MSAGTGPDVFPQRRNTFAAREKIGIASPLIAHSGEHAAHIGEAFDHPGHRVVTVDLILQVYVALVFDGDERLKDGADRHFSVPYRHLALFDLQVGEVFHVNVKYPGSYFADGLDRVSPGTGTVAYINTAAHTRIHVSDGLQNIERRVPYFVFRSVIVDSEAYVVLLHKFLDARKGLGQGVTGNDHFYASALCIVELWADVVIFIFPEIDRSYRSGGYHWRRSHAGLLRSPPEVLREDGPSR